jgi:hypothetical protein
MITHADGARMAQAVLGTAAFARAHGVALPADLLLDLERVQAMAAARGWQVEKGYNPSQPRDPKGSPTGGQWTDEAASDGKKAPRRADASAFRPQVFYDEKTRGDGRWAMEALGVDEDELRQMFGLEGYRTLITVDTTASYSNPRAHKPAFEAVVEWWTDEDDSRKVGYARRLVMDEGEYQICYNEEMEFEPEFQDHDLAHELYERQIEVLARDTEVDAIRMFADISIGRYAWARKGFQYFRPNEAEGHNVKLRSWLGRLGIEAPDLPTFTTPQQFADFRVPGVKVSHRDIRNDEVKSGEYEVGKAFMLDGIGHGDWSGVLWLKK